MWFEDLMGFPEESPSQVRAMLSIEGEFLVSSANGRRFQFGSLATPTLAELRRQASSMQVRSSNRIQVDELVADVGGLHSQSENSGALFQVASQFNLLEMVSSEVTPETGVGRYEYDRTQGPVCAIACGAGTIYRNYFAEVNGQLGQSADNQIDCLADFSKHIGNLDCRFWKMKNGYVMSSDLGLRQLNERLNSLSKEDCRTLSDCLRVGVQWNTEVTEIDEKAESHLVTQVYASALPVSYNDMSESEWEPFARIVLNAAYEATLGAAMLNFAKTGNNRVFLTLLGGGVFGNRLDWIMDGIRRAVVLYQDSGLHVSVVSYRRSNLSVAKLVKDLQ